MKKNRDRTIAGPYRHHPAALLMGVMFAPATPSLLWVSLGANLPITEIIVPLLVMALAPNMLLYLMFRTCNRLEETSSHTVQPAAVSSTNTHRFNF